MKAAESQLTVWVFYMHVHKILIVLLHFDYLAGWHFEGYRNQGTVCTQAYMYTCMYPQLIRA